MSTPPNHTLSILITGRGLTPHSPSHWSFLLQPSSSPYIDILHVQPISLSPLWYHFDFSVGVDISTLHAEGMVRIAELTTEERRKVVSVIKAEAENAPRDGKRGAQEWVVDTLIALEVEELVRPGMADGWGDFRRKGSTEVKRFLREGEGKGKENGEWVDLR